MLKKSFNLEDNFYHPEHINNAIEDFWKDFLICYKNHILEITAESNEIIDEVFQELINYITGLYNESI